MEIFGLLFIPTSSDTGRQERERERETVNERYRVEP